MNEYDRIAKLVNSQANFFKNITPSLMNEYQSVALQAVEIFNQRNLIFENSITDIAKAYTQITKNLPYIVDNFATTYKSLPIIAEKLAISYKYLPDIIAKQYLEIKNCLPSIINTVNDFYNYKTGLFKTLSESNIDNTKYYDFNVINDINTSITRTITELSGKDKFNENDNAKVEDLGNYAYEISTSKNVPVYVKKNILINLWRNICNVIDNNRKRPKRIKPKRYNKQWNKNIQKTK
jgi:hypothetical protein